VPQDFPKRVGGILDDSSHHLVVPSPDRTWLRELDAQHGSVRVALSALTSRVDRVPTLADRCDSHSELLGLIGDIEALLKAHFAFEEAGGHLGDALSVAPRLSQRAAHLQSDHRRLTAAFAELASFARRMGQADENWELVGVKIREFVVSLQAHELEENRLVQEAYLDDLGGGG
jgi:hypothetical protein